MRTMPRFRTTTIQDLARRGLRPATLVATLSLLSACLTPPRPWAPGDGQLIAPRDSAALAYDTGRRDGLLQRGRTASAATSFILPVALTLGLFVRRPGTNNWVTPASIVAIGAGGALWDYRETQQPIPAPPDSMRARYGLTDPRLWTSYNDGFRKEIEERRQADLTRSSRSALLTAIIFGGTYAALHRH